MRVLRGPATVIGRSLSRHLPSTEKPGRKIRTEGHEPGDLHGIVFPDGVSAEGRPYSAQKNGLHRFNDAAFYVHKIWRTDQKTGGSLPGVPIDFGMSG